MNVILSGLKCHFAVFQPQRKIIIKQFAAKTYLSCTTVHPLLQSAATTLKHKNCKLSGDFIDYLHHVAWSKRLEFAFHTTFAVFVLQPPRNLTKLRPFLGLSSVFWGVFPAFPRITTSQNQHLKNYQPAIFISLNKNELHAMDSLKNALICPTILTPSDSNEHMTLDKNVCNV